MTENPLPTVTAAQPQRPTGGTQLNPEELFPPVDNVTPTPAKRGHVRAGITTNKGHGQSKARRQMAKQSRRANRGKR